MRSWKSWNWGDKILWGSGLQPQLEAKFRKGKKQPVGNSWRMDETYIKIKGQWKYLYRAVDNAGQTIDFLLTARRDKKAALRFFKKAVRQHGLPDKVTRWTSSFCCRTFLFFSSLIAPVGYPTLPLKK
jgi:hypothetical protein